MKIINKEILGQSQGTKTILLEVISPDIAAKAQAGQFVALMVCQEGERIPLTIVDKDQSRGTITLIFQEVGLTTRLLARLNTGDSLYALVGPLGHPTEIKNYGKVILVGGGVGIAEVYPAAKALKEKGNQIISILGARTKELLILEKELTLVSDGIYLTTDDGSYARKGFVTDVLKELLEKEKYELVYAVGPIAMMRRVSEITKDFKVKTVVSLNALMVDATGMCGCCRVSIKKEVRFSCVDGPEFDALDVDWQELEQRNRIYADKERHICNLHKS